MRSLSVAIAGAGPGGLAAALFLARDGHRVTVFERFEVPQPLGSGLMLQPTGLAVLAELGLAPAVMALGRRIDRLFGRAAPSNRIVLDVRYDAIGGGHFALAVHRAALFGPLFQAVTGTAAIRVETARTVTGLTCNRHGRPSLRINGGDDAGPFDLVVDAAGVRSPLAPHFGAGTRRELSYGALWASVPWTASSFDPHALEQRYRRASVMVGVLPVGRRVSGGGDEAAFFWSLRDVDYAAWQKAGLAVWKTEVRKLWPETEPLLAAIVEPEQLTFARYAHHTLRHPVAERMAAIGDSAHAASPQLGQGANMALLDARALAFALHAHDDVASALAAYAHARRWHVRAYQALSATFTPFYQSDSAILPILRDRLLAPVIRLPYVRAFIATTVAGLLLDPRARLQLGDGAAALQMASQTCGARSVGTPCRSD
jgi:salicylate hydroxylase